MARLCSAVLVLGVLGSVCPSEPTTCPCLPHGSASRKWFLSGSWSCELPLVTHLEQCEDGDRGRCSLELVPPSVGWWLSTPPGCLSVHPARWRGTGSAPSHCTDVWNKMKAAILLLNLKVARNLHLCLLSGQQKPALMQNIKFLSPLRQIFALDHRGNEKSLHYVFICFKIIFSKYQKTRRGELEVCSDELSWCFEEAVSCTTKSFSCADVSLSAP